MLGSWKTIIYKLKQQADLYADTDIDVTMKVIHISNEPNARAVLGEYRPEVLRVRTERGKDRTKKSEGRYSSSPVPSKLG